MKHKRKFTLASAMILPANIWAVYLDNYSSAASPSFAYGCIYNDLTPCTVTITGSPALVVDDDPNTSFYITKTTLSPEAKYWFQIDYGAAGVKVKTAIYRAEQMFSYSSNFWVSVGYNSDPTQNPICGSMLNFSLLWNMQSCNLFGRYVSLIQEETLTRNDLILFDFKTWPYPTIKLSQIQSEGTACPYPNFVQPPPLVSITQLNTSGYSYFHWSQNCLSVYSFTLKVPLQILEIYLGTDTRQAPIQVFAGTANQGTFSPTPPTSTSNYFSARLSLSVFATTLAFINNQLLSQTWYEMAFLYNDDPCINATFIDQTFSAVLTTTALSAAIITQSFTEFLDTVGNNLQCGPRVYQLISYSGTYLTLNSGPTTFSLVLQSLLATDSASSPYSVIFKVNLLNYPTVFLQKTLNIIIGQCVPLMFTPSGNFGFTTLTKQVTVAATVIPVVTYSMTPACGYAQINTVLAQQLTPIFGLLGTAAFWTLAGSSMSLQSNNISLIDSSYQIQQKSTFNGITAPIITATVIWADPCLTANIIDQTFSVIFTTTALSSTILTQIFTEFLDTVGNSFQCGPRLYELIGYSGTFLTLNPGPATFSLVLQSMLASDSAASPYSVIFKVSLVNYPAVTLQKPLNIIISACVIMSLAYSNFGFTTLSKAIGDSAKVIPVVTYNIWPACGYPQVNTLYAQQLTPTVGGNGMYPFWTLSGSSMSLQSNDITIAGSSYEIKQYSTFNGIQAPVISATVTWYDPCPNATFIDQTFSVILMTTALAAAIITQSFTEFLDTVGNNLQCGPRVYQLISYSGNYLTLNSGPITFSLVLQSLLATDSASSPYSVIFKVSLLNYPTIFLQKTLNIIIGQCEPATCYSQPSNRNMLPTFVQPNDWPQQVTLGCGQAWVYKVPECEDPNNDICETYIDLGPANIFAKKDSVLKLIYVEKDVLNKNLQGVYPVKVILSDGKGKAIQIMEIIVACIMSLVQKNPDDQWQPKSGSIIPQVSKINNIGQVSISFSEPMLFQNTGNLTNGTIRANKVTRPALEIKMIPYDLEKIIDFSWNCTNYTSTSLDLQLIFARPGIVTYQQSPRDQIQITFWGQDYFTSDPISTQSTQLRRLDAQEYVEYGFNLTCEVPPQIELNLGQLIATFGQAIQITGESFEIGAFVLNMFVSGSLQHLFSQVKKMQIVVHQILVNLPLPASVQIFYGYLLPIVAFDLIPTDGFYDDLLDLPKPQAINHNFEALGYESKYFIRNIGSIGIYFSLYPCIGLTSFAIGKLCKCKKAQQVSQRLKNVLYWNGWFSLVEDSFLTLTVSIMLNLILYSPDDFSSFGRAINFCIAAISAPAVIIHLGLVIYILNKKFDLIRRRHPNTDKFNYLFSDLQIRANHENLTVSLSGKQTTSYPIWSYFRKLILGVSAVGMTDYPVFFLFLMNFTTLTSIIIVGTQEPFAEKVKNSMDLFNEFAVLVINYHLLCFTDFVGDPDTRVYVGYCLILVTCLFLGINITFASLRMGQKPCTRVRYSYLRIRALKKKNEKKKKQAKSSVEPVLEQGIQFEKIGLFRSQKDMSDKASQIGCRLGLNNQEPVSQAEVQAVEAIKNDLQVVNLEDQDDLQFRNNFSTGTYKFNHANRSDYFVEPQTVQDIRNSYLVQPLAIKSNCNKNLIEAKTKIFTITQQLQSVVGVVLNKEEKSEIENVADLEIQLGSGMKNVKPYFTTAIGDQPNMARLMKLQESKTENIVSKPIGLKPKQFLQRQIRQKVIPGKPKKQLLSPYTTTMIRAPSTKKKITYYHEKVNYAQPWIQAAQAVIAHQAAGAATKAKLIAEKEKKQKAQQQ